MGAHVVIDPAQDSPYRAWRELAVPATGEGASPLQFLGLGPRLRPGVIFECVGVPGVLQQVIDGALRGTRIVVVGVCMERDHVEPFFAIQKQLELQFVLGYTPEEFQRTLGQIAAGQLDVAPLVTGRVGIDGVPGAFHALANPEQHAKILVEPGWTG